MSTLYKLNLPTFVLCSLLSKLEPFMSFCFIFLEIESGKLWLYLRKLMQFKWNPNMASYCMPNILLERWFFINDIMKTKMISLIGFSRVS